MSGLETAGMGIADVLLNEGAGFWDRLVALRAAILRVLGPFAGPVGWGVLLLLFAVLILAVLRAGSKADAPEL